MIKCLVINKNNNSIIIEAKKTPEFWGRYDKAKRWYSPTNPINIFNYLGGSFKLEWKRSQDNILFLQHHHSHRLSIDLNI